MKKSVKYILIFLIILICLALINFTRNMIIINGLVNKSINLSSMDNYHITENTHIISQNRNIKNDLYVKNNIYLLKQYEENNLSVINWKNYDNDEEKAFYVSGDDIEYNEDLIKSLKDTIIFRKKISLGEKVSFSLFHILNIKDNYIIAKENNTKYYYNKSTGILEKIESENSNTTFMVEFNCVSDEDVAKP